MPNCKSADLTSPQSSNHLRNVVDAIDRRQH